jgi:hypothetical protein
MELFLQVTSIERLCPKSQRGPRDFETLEKRDVIGKKEPVEVRMIRERITALDLD